MSLFSLIAALLLEHLRPLGGGNPVSLAFTRYANYLERHFNAGQNVHGPESRLAQIRRSGRSDRGTGRQLRPTREKRPVWLHAESLGRRQ